MWVAFEKYSFLELLRLLLPVSLSRYKKCLLTVLRKCFSRNRLCLRNKYQQRYNQNAQYTIFHIGWWRVVTIETTLTKPVILKTLYIPLFVRSPPPSTLRIEQMCRYEHISTSNYGNMCKVLIYLRLMDHVAEGGKLYLHTLSVTIN